MSCQPSYNYEPIFTPSSNKSPDFTPGVDCCALPSAATRSRLFAGGTYFRSIDVAPNPIELEVTGPPGLSVGPFFLNVYVDFSSAPCETFGPVVQVINGFPPPLCLPAGGAIIPLRALVGNDPTGGCGVGPLFSSYIEMVPRPPTGAPCDTKDGGTDADCLTIFSKTLMTGGGPSEVRIQQEGCGLGSPVTTDPSGIPTTGFQDPIRTGSQRTMVILKTVEDYFGNDVEPAFDGSPPIIRKVMQWNGTAWEYYENLVQGSCPVDGPSVPFL